MKLETPLPCPFCGSEPELEPYSVTRRSAKWHIGCTNNGCHAGPGLVAPTRKVALGRWNSRTQPEKT